MRTRGFSLVELVIVIVILGMIAAIAVPRISRATTGMEESALRADLQTLRKAVELYKVDHNGTPPTALHALAMYTSETGAMSNNKTALYKFGKYVREIPPCPVGPNKGATGSAVANATPPTVVSGVSTVGWLYHWQTGGVYVNDEDHLTD